MTDDSARSGTGHGHGHGHGPRSREQLIGEGVTWLSRWTLRWLVVFFGALVVGFAISRVWSILLPVALAMILTTVLEPVARLLERRLRFPVVLAAATALVGLLVILVLLVLLLTPSVTDQVADIASNASFGLSQVEDWFGASRFNISQDQVQTVISAIQDRISSSASAIASGVLIGVGAVTNVVINLLLTLVLTFFFLKDGRRFLPWVARLTGPRVGTHLSEVGTRAWRTLGSFIRTQALVGAIDGLLIGAGLVVLGVPLAVPLAILTFFGGFVPIIGAVTVGALAVLVTLVTNGFTAAVIILVVILAVQQIEGNILQPFLQGKSMQLHAAVILLSVTLGSSLFGIIGAFLAVPVVSVAAVTMRYLDEQVKVRTDVPVVEGPEPAPEDPEQPEAEATDG